jgi:AcrR family transcriptional regulator
VIATAATLFLERGYHNTSIEDVAEAAGISKPTVYKYVESKQWLLDTIMLQVLDELSTIFTPWSDDVEVLKVQVDEYVDFGIDAATRLRVFYRILFSEETEMSEGVRKRWRAFATEATDHFEQLLIVCRDLGRVAPDVNTRVMANLFVTTFVSVHRWYYPERSVSPDEVRSAIKQLLTGVFDLDFAD